MPSEVDHDQAAAWRKTMVVRMPAEGRRVGRLHLPLVGLGDFGQLGGSEAVPPVWAGRRAHRLQYASQREAK